MILVCSNSLRLCPPSKLVRLSGLGEGDAELTTE